MRIVDLRSDTVTQPTQEMREAMYKAEVGDDVYGEDPTVNRLEEAGAEKLGFEAGLFVASGTMGNLVAVLAHTQKGEEVILEEESHIYYYEVGGMAVAAGTLPLLIKGERGIITPQQVKDQVRGENIHYPSPTLLCIENTHNRGGGSVYTPEETERLVACAKDLGLRVHIDGARIFNAALACACDVKKLVQGADSVQFCLSKGLCAPMGSLVVGSKEFIARARKWRKLLGGGFRQIGLMAAAGLIALDKMVAPLIIDHQNAKRLAGGLAAIPYFSVNPALTETNIVMAILNTQKMTLPRFLEGIKEKGIKANVYGTDRVRFVTHRGIEKDDIDYTLCQLAKIS